jgi:dUTP pyrophosphatase
MHIRIKRFDTSLPMPEYKTAGAAAFDLVARLDITIEAESIGYIPLNVAIEVPKGYWVMLAARSSTHKTGLMLANGVGVMDSDYCGDNDEYKLVVYNFTKEPVTVTRGQRIAQAMVLPVPQIDIEEVEHLGNADRGAFGTTGV